MPVWLLAIPGTLKKIPWQLWLTGLFFLSLFLCYKAGQRDVRKEWESSIAKGTQIVDKLKDDQKVNTVKATINFKLQETKIHERIKTVTKEIPVYIPADAKLPNGFVLLYNASVSDTSIPRPSEGDGSYELALRDAAPIIFRNNESCLIISAKHKNLWDWYLGQKSLADAAVKELQR